MKTLAYRRSRVLGACLFALAGAPVCAAQTVPADWKTDCVGRMQIGLPGEVDVAADTATSWRDGPDPVARFYDEQTAGWSSSYYLGQLKISHSWATDDLEGFMQKSVKSRDKFRPGGEVQKKLGGRPFKELATSPLKGIAWQFGDTRYSVLRIDSHMVGWTASGSDYIDDYYQTLLTGLRPRPLFDVPKEPGVCLPYLFVKDDGKVPRHVGMTYRLKAHPDITVWLEDASAATIEKNQNPAKFTPEDKSNFFWTQRYQDRQSVASEWLVRYPSATLAGHKGVKSFVRLIRLDGKTRDYGYLVAVRGDPQAKEDQPDLMLYVIQDSLNARKQGIEPLDKDAFLKMAETIAASVTRRQVGAP